MFKFIKKIFGNERKDAKMSKVIYIYANPKPKELSYSLTVGDVFLQSYKNANPNDEIITLDLYNMDITFIDGDVLSGWGKLAQKNSFQQLNPSEQKKISSMNTLLEQFISADKYVFATPLWNFTVPPMMKAYLDNICIAGKTFKYTENGAEGMLTGKKAVHIQARGGIYTSGPAADFEMGDKYINSVLSFVGITDKQSIIIEGVNAMPDKAEEIKENAITRAKEVAQSF